jgi:acetyl esterase/lipase
MATLFQNLGSFLRLGLCLVGFFLSLWIVLPASTALWLPLSVGAPEISCWLMGVNAISLLLLLFRKRTTLSFALIGCSTLGLLLSSLPLIQLSATIHTAEIAMQQGLGLEYLSTIPANQKDQFRSYPFSFLDALRGIPQPKVRQQSSLSFAQPEGVPLSLEIYQPLQPGRYPGVVAIYGGAWQHGDPTANSDFNRYVAAQGYVVWAIDYRHAPQHRFPSQLEDVQMALNFIQSHADEYETDPERLVLVGRSAGAHLALLAAYSTNQLQIRGVVNYYGPVDLTSGYNHPPIPDPINTRSLLEDFIGGSPEQFPDRYRQASPLTFVTQPLPPTLLIYGSRDHIVEAQYGQQLHQRLQAVDSPSVYIEIPWADHSFDSVFNGASSQLALYYAERFIAWSLSQKVG